MDFMASGRRSEAKPDETRTASPDKTVSVGSSTDAWMASCCRFGEMFWKGLVKQGSKTDKNGLGAAK